MSPRRAVLALAAVIAATFVVYAAVARAAVFLDLTAERSATLSAETLRVLKRVDHRIEITAFYPRDEAGRVEAATLLARYHRANRKITFRVLDPSLVPGEAQRLGVQEEGSAAVHDLAHPSKIEIAQYTIEIDVTSAIARLLRNVHGTVCFTSGHGERSISDDLAQAAALLRDNGYLVRSVDLLASQRIPRCSAIVVAAPTSRLDDTAERITLDYLQGGGRGMFLADPSARADLNPLVKPWGIRFTRGVVLEGDEGAHLPNDVTSPIVSHYAGGSSVVRGLAPTFFPRTMGVDAKPSKDPGLVTTNLAFTSPLGYLDRKDASRFDPKVDEAGPIAVGASADASLVQRPGTARASIQRTRIFAWGDVDFATNAFLGEGGNARLFIQGIDWLTQPEDLVTAVPNFPKLRELDLTAARSSYVLFLMAGVVPVLFLIAGALVWVVRRGR